jgi:hypothetical protein
MTRATFIRAETLRLSRVRTWICRYGQGATIDVPAISSMKHRYFRLGSTLPNFRLSGRAVNKVPVVMLRRAAQLWR